MTDVFALADFPIHLGLGARAEREPQMDGQPEWFEAYGARHAEDDVEGRLVSMFTFTEAWDTWEMHPLGHEVVVCVSGEMVLHQEIDGEVATVTLGPGEAIINPPGAWHTADVEVETSGFFITAGMGTEIRPR